TTDRRACVRARAVSRDRGKVVPVLAVAPVRANPEPAEIDADDAQFPLGAVDEIAREQAENDVVARLERVEKLGHAREQRDTVIFALQFDHQLAEVRREHGLHLRVDVDERDLHSPCAGSGADPWRVRSSPPNTAAAPTPCIKVGFSPSSGHEAPSATIGWRFENIAVRVDPITRTPRYQNR